MRWWAGRLVGAAIVFLLLGLCPSAAQAAPLKYTPTSLQLQAQRGQVAEFQLLVQAPSGTVTAAAPKIQPVGNNRVIPSAWVSAAPSEATFGTDGITFVISIMVPAGADAGDYHARIGARVIQGAADDGNGCRVALNVVNYQPAAGFSYTPANPIAGQGVQFTDTSTDPDGEVVAWAWSFGDGETSSDRHPAHVYVAGGWYAVTLTVTDDDGSQASASAWLEVYSDLAPDTETPEVVYRGARVVSADWEVRLSAEILAGAYDEPRRFEAGLATFVVLDWEWNVVGELPASQAAHPAAAHADAALGPGIYRVYTILPGGGNQGSTLAGPELLVASPAGDGALAAWGALEGSEAQFALLVTDGEGASALGQFAYWDAATQTSVSSASVVVTAHTPEGVEIAGICAVHGVHGYQFTARLTNVGGDRVFSLWVSGALLAHGEVGAGAGAL